MTTTKEVEARNSWIGNKSGRAQFWAAVGSAGLSKDNVHELFGIDSMYEYDGTLAEAIGVIRAWETDHSPPGGSPPPAAEEAEVETEEGAVVNNLLEATVIPPVHSFSTKVYKDGYDCIIKIESHDTKDLLHRGQLMLEYLKSHGYEPTYFSNGNGKPTAKQAASGNGSGGTKFFNPKTLVYAGKSDAGDLYWRCKGHPFEKYGVIIWQDALPTELKDKAMTNLAQDLDLTGWAAEYTEQVSEKSGKVMPDKVISLTRGA